MTFSEYLVGIIYLFVIGGAFGLIGVEVRRRLLPAWSGSPARLCEVVGAIGAFVATAELLGLFGALTRVGFLLGAVAAAAVAHIVAAHLRAADDAPGRTGGAPGGARRNPRPLHPPPAAWAVAVAVAVAAIVILHWCGGVRESLDFGIYRQDSTWYHLPVAAGFFQTGDTWSLHFTDPMALTAWFYPMNSELLHTAGMLAFGNDFLSPFLNLLWMVLALLAAWCIGRPFGLGPQASIAVAVVLDSGMMQAQAGNAPSDVAGLFFLLASAAILVNSDASGRAGGVAADGGPLLLAALAAGLAAGTKITLLVPVVVITCGVMILAGRGRRWRPAALWIGGALLGGGFWYARNLWHAGNPLPWISLGPLSTPDQLPLYPRPPHSLADYATDLHVWTHSLAPQLVNALGYLWPLVLAAAAAGSILALLHRRSIRTVLGAAAIAAALAYVFIPVSASGSSSHPTGFESNLRYLAPALALGLALLVLESSRSPRTERFVTAGMVAVFGLDAISSSGWGTSQLPLGILSVGVLLVAPISATRMRRGDVPAAAIVGVALISLAVVVGLGYPAERSYLRGRYLPSLAPPADNPGFRATAQWRRLQGWGRRVQGARIGIVGPPAAFGQYVFYGPDLSDRVDYVGEPGPHGSYRPIEDCTSWRRAVNRGDYDYVVVTPASAIGPGAVPQEILWTGSDPAAHLILRAGPGAVYRIEGRLDPRGCTSRHLPPVVRVPGGGFVVPGSQFPGPAPEGDR